jgi:hypothetical protein
MSNKNIIKLKKIKIFTIKENTCVIRENKRGT